MFRGRERKKDINPITKEHWHLCEERLQKKRVREAVKTEANGLSRDVVLPAPTSGPCAQSRCKNSVKDEARTKRLKTFYR